MVAAAILILNNGCQRPEQDYIATSTIREIMKSMIDPSANSLYNAVSSSVTSDGVKEKSPKTEEEWDEVRRQAITLIEASDLIVLTGRHVAGPAEVALNPRVQLSPAEIEAMIAKDRASWVKMAHDLHDSIRPALKAIDEKNPMALSDSTIAIDMTCESCHVKFWYPDKR